MTARDTIDLGVIEARAQRTVERTERYLDALGDSGDPDEIDDAIREQGGARDTLALVARVRDLAADVWRAAGETHEPPADVAALLARVAAARREGAEAMREACAEAADYVAASLNPAAAIRALPLPEAPPDASTYRRGAGAMREACAQAAARVASAWARCECRCACGSSLAGLAAAEACAAAIRALPIVEAP